MKPTNAPKLAGIKSIRGTKNTRPIIGSDPAKKTSVRPFIIGTRAANTRSPPSLVIEAARK
jgi:hypothetical protein